MEPSKEAISVRMSRICNLFAGHVPNNKAISTSKHTLTREGLLDALIVLYNEFNQDNVKKVQNVSLFIEKFRGIVVELRSQRVNLCDFYVQSVIGRGHFGEVQVVKEKHTGDIYAMKTLRKNGILKNPSAAFYEEERDIMACTTSPWLTSLQYAFQDTNNLYLVMEYHPGGDMLMLLDHYGNSLSEEMARFYLAELALAIKSLHSMGYVHRDIKPGNILLDRCGHIKLADFGSAAKLTASGCVISMMAVGTPEYIAPEILQVMENNNKGKKKGTYGVECDYWSLGIVAYELVIGTTPFGGAALPDTYLSIMNHTTALKWPAKDTFSAPFLDLVAKLLTQSGSRIGADKLAHHAFFKSIDWNSLRNMVPPHVPILTSDDDTSNFPKLSREPQAPCPEDYQTRVTGRDLPFIGFTFTHGSAVLYRNKDMDLSIVEVTRKEPRREIDELQKKLAIAEQRGNQKNNKYESLVAELESKLRLLNDTEVLSKKLEHDYQRSQKENMALKRAIETGREEQKSQETKALSLIRETKEKLLRKHREEETRLANEVHELTCKLNERNDHNDKLCDKLLKQEHELAAAQMEVSELQVVAKVNNDKLSKVRQSVRQSVSGADRQMEQLTRGHKEQIYELERCLSEERNARKASDLLLDAEKLKTAEIQIELNRSEADLKACRDENARLVEKNAKLTRETERMRASYQQDLAKRQDVGHTQISELQKRLGQEKAQVTSLQNQLAAIEVELNESVMSREAHETTLTARQAAREEQIAVLAEKLKEAQEKEANESIKSSHLESRLDDIQRSLQRLEEENASLKKRNTSECRQKPAEIDVEKHVLEAQIKKLDEQLAKIHETSVLDRKAKAECESKLWKIEKELSDTKIDLRIAQRETKTGMEEIKLLLDEKKTRQLKAITEKEALVQERSALNEKISEHIQHASELQQKLTAAENDVATLRLVTDEAKAKLAKKVEELAEIKTEMKSINSTLEKERENNRIRELRISSLMDENKLANSKCCKAVEKEKMLARSLDAMTQKYDSVVFNFDQLKETCSMLDEELEDYLKKIDSLNVKVESSTKEKNSIQAEVSGLQDELQVARQATNEEKSLKLKTEIRVKMLEADLVSKAEELAAVEMQMKDFKRMAEHLTSQVSDLEDSGADAESRVESERRRNEGLVLESNSLKEELSRYLTQMHSLKESNFKLTQDLKASEDERNELRDSLAHHQNVIDELQAYHQQRDFKTRAQLAQQTKLIDYLQQKVEESGKRKKTLTEKLFGAKENVAPSNKGPLAVRDTENLLTQERAKNQALTEQLMKAQAQRVVSKNERVMDAVNSRTTDDVIETPRTKQAVVALSHAASDHPGFDRQASTLRMGHNIPHRFELRLCMRATKCAACLDSVHFGRNAATCLECGVQAHTKCSMLLPHACGLPLAFARHYSRTQAESGVGGNAGRVESIPVRMEGYVKLPSRGNSCWERRFLMLEGTALKVFEHEPTAGMVPIDTLQLCPDNGVTSISSAVPSAGVINTAESDLPYLIKITVTPLTTCWPGNSMLFMTLDFADKQAWASALEAVVQKSKATLSSRPRNQGTLVLALARDRVLDVNCVLQLSPGLVLMGAAEGLFSLRVGTPGACPVKIAGVQDVHQIALVPAVGIALMIAGTKRELVLCELRQLMSSAEAAACANASIEPTPVLMPTTAQGASCHLFAVATTTDSNHHSRTTLCAATVNMLILLTWSINNRGFNVVKTLETAEPCSCIHFASHSILVGCNKFFEIDLRDFSADEFLDPSDKSLTHACHTAQQLNSFPIAIIDVSSSRANPEYLLAFNEFGVFVDKFGQRSRIEDVKWSHMPFAFAYRKPYLFIFHFTSVEVMKLTSDSFTRDADDSVATVNYPGQTFIEMDSPKLLGVSTETETVYVSHMTERSGLQLVAMSGSLVFKDDTGFSCSSLDTVQTKDTADLNTDFSFTSSLVQSLDGSDATEEEHIARRVHFNSHNIMHTEL